MGKNAQYLQASSTRPGALGIIQAYADDALLAERIDSRFRPGKSAAKAGLPLRDGELRYGWLTDGRGESIDEAMLAKPADGLRVLMTHGGAMVRQAVTALLQELGFSEMPADEAGDGMLDPLLSAALTQTQAAAILDAREKARAGNAADIPASLLLTHRVLLAGPPNAGKSSLLNRLAGYDRAFVHEEPGATLDVVDELVDLGGFAVMLGDLPGFRQSADDVEQAAWQKAEARLRLAEAVLFVADGSQPWSDAAERAAASVAEHVSAPVLVVLNKSDLPLAIEGRPWEKHFPAARAIRLSSLPDGDAAEALAPEAWRLLAGPTHEKVQFQ